MPASAWATAKAEAVCADSVWTDELVGRMAAALDEAEQRGFRKGSEAVDRLTFVLSDTGRERDEALASASRLRERIRERAKTASFNATKQGNTAAQQQTASAIANALRGLLEEEG